MTKLTDQAALQLRVAADIIRFERTKMQLMAPGKEQRDRFLAIDLDETKLEIERENLRRIQFKSIKPKF